MESGTGGGGSGVLLLCLSCLFLSSWNDMLRPAPALVPPSASVGRETSRRCRPNLDASRPEEHGRPSSGRGANRAGGATDARRAQSPNPSPRDFTCIAGTRSRRARVPDASRGLVRWAGEKCAMCQRANSSNRRLAMRAFRSFAHSSASSMPWKLTCSPGYGPTA